MAPKIDLLRSPNPAKFLEPRLLAEIRLQPAKADLHPEWPWRYRLGIALGRSLGFAHATKKDLWAALGHVDGSTVSRWLSGTSRLHLDTLFDGAPWLQKPFLLGLATEIEDGASLQTVITVKQGQR